VWVSSKPLITEENWLGQGLNPGLPNDTPALYPLLHELMLKASDCLLWAIKNLQEAEVYFQWFISISRLDSKEVIRVHYN
jgi:hypothetical protein